MKKIFTSALLLTVIVGTAQQTDKGNDYRKEIYQATPTKINALVHTKLDAKFDFDKAYLYGRAWLSLKPYFYPTDSLTLDAKGMEIKQVAIVKAGKNVPLNYNYNGFSLTIKLDKTYNDEEPYTVFIDYIAKPNEFKAQGSAAISDAKGLYFINPKGEEKNKPTQIWTQGETEATSVWIPIIDKTNQKTTQEISMAVPDKYVTLSNGKLVSQKKNTDGTRTDTWKMDLPHAPYLFFMGVGEYAIVKDSYKGKEVSYYVEKPYERVARKIFGNTPEMMQFFSQKLGVEYPWVKYAQIVGRDYVSGAMENTTATLHQESAQQDARELVDENKWEDVVSHELFHHWFGDLVTAESWSNLTVNESFADYSEYLWREYKYGKDAADAHGYSAMQSYLNSPAESSKDLVRFHYRDKEDMFDLVSYQKGGRILHMLRKYVGDDAFFKGLNLYLTQNKFKTGEAHQLRLAFEEVTGKDLNWFFNQWYFNSGHPVLDISYGYTDANKKVIVSIKQTQKTDKLFKLPLAIDIYNGSQKTRHNVWVEHKADSFSFSVSGKPDLINVDGEKITLASKKDTKTLPEYIHQYKYGGNYVSRKEALDYAAKRMNDVNARKLVIDALKDTYYELRSKALNSFTDSTLDETTKVMVEQIAKNDPKRTVRADALELLGVLKDIKNKPLFINNLKDSSYTVAGTALEALYAIDPQEAINQAKELDRQPSKGRLSAAISLVYMQSGDESIAERIITSFENMPLSQAKVQTLQQLSGFLSNAQKTETVKKGVEAIVKFREGIPGQYKDQFAPFINNIILGNIISKKEAEIKVASNANDLQEQVNYIKSKISPMPSSK